MLLGCFLCHKVRGVWVRTMYEQQMDTVKLPSSTASCTSMGIASTCQSLAIACLCSEQDMYLSNSYVGAEAPGKGLMVRLRTSINLSKGSGTMLRAASKHLSWLFSCCKLPGLPSNLDTVAASQCTLQYGTVGFLIMDAVPQYGMHLSRNTDFGTETCPCYNFLQ